MKITFRIYKKSNQYIKTTYQFSFFSIILIDCDQTNRNIKRCYG